MHALAPSQQLVACRPRSRGASSAPRAAAAARPLLARQNIASVAALRPSARSVRGRALVAGAAFAELHDQDEEGVIDLPSNFSFFKARQETAALCSTVGCSLPSPITQLEFPQHRNAAAIRSSARSRSLDAGFIFTQVEAIVRPWRCDYVVAVGFCSPHLSYLTTACISRLPAPKLPSRCIGPVSFVSSPRSHRRSTRAGSAGSLSTMSEAAACRVRAICPLHSPPPSPIAGRPRPHLRLLSISPHVCFRWCQGALPRERIHPRHSGRESEARGGGQRNAGAPYPRA